MQIKQFFLVTQLPHSLELESIACTEVSQVCFLSKNKAAITFSGKSICYSSNLQPTSQHWTTQYWTILSSVDMKGKAAHLFSQYANLL